MVLLARSAVMPSYGLVRMKCGSCESCITYSSSIITYRPSSWRLSAIHDAISTMILLRYQHWSLLLFSLVQPLSPGRRKLHTCLSRISHDTYASSGCTRYSVHRQNQEKLFSSYTLFYWIMRDEPIQRECFTV